MIEQPPFHKSVLVNEALTYLNSSQGNLYLDATLGGGGHTRALLSQNQHAQVIGIDWDQASLEHQTTLLQAQFGERFQPLWGNFAHLYRLIKKTGISAVDGILADFGTSQHQIQTTPGLSLYNDAPLDMRMSTAHNFIKASDIINRYQEKALANIFFNFADEGLARPIAKAIVQQRMIKPFTTTLQLAETVARVVYKYSKTERKIHPATKVFQALRIYVNKELENIEHFLKAALPLLKPQGRLVCISFHSLEDRLVKNFFRERSDVLITLTPKPVTAQPNELEANPSARSAKLRAAEKQAS